MIYRISRRLVIALTLLALLLTACGPAVTSYTTRDGTLTFEHPEDWQVLEQEDGLVAIGTPNTDLLVPATFQDDQFVVYIGGISPESIEYLKDAPLFLQVVPSDPPQAGEMVNFLMALLTGSDDKWFSMGPIERNTIGEYDAARVNIARKDENSTIEGVVLEIDTGNGGYVTLRAAAADGSLEAFEEVLLQIAESVVYTP